MKYIISANKRTEDQNVAPNHITRNFTQSTSIVRFAPIDPTTGRLVKFLKEEELRSIEKMIDASKEPGWMSFTLEESKNVWLGSKSKFLFEVRGSSRELDMTDGYDKVAYLIGKHAGLIGEPDAPGKHIFDVHKGSIITQRAGIVAFDNLDTIIKEYDKLKFKGEKLGYALFVSKSKPEVISENPSDEELKTLIKSTFMVGSNFNVNKLDNIINELKAKTPAEFKATIYWELLDFIKEFETRATNVGTSYKYKDKSFKNREAGINFIAKGLVEGLELAKSIETLVQNYK